MDQTIAPIHSVCLSLSFFFLMSAWMLFMRSLNYDSSSCAGSPSCTLHHYDTNSNISVHIQLPIYHAVNLSVAMTSSEQLSGDISSVKSERRAEQEMFRHTEVDQTSAPLFQLQHDHFGLPARSFLANRGFFSYDGSYGSRLILVDRSGLFGHFQTIQAAVNSIPVNNTRVYTILVAGGVFEEKVIIPHNKPFIRLQGIGRSDETVIAWHDTAATECGPSGPKNCTADKSRNASDGNQRPLGTLHSATVAVNAPEFIARGITFQNTAPAPASGVTLGGQAVALQVSGDRAAFYDCKFLGRQDTLYDHRGRHYFKNCYIEGSVDFIFGDGLSLYKACQIHANGPGFITAQKRQNASDNTGFSFVGCEVRGSCGTGVSYLERAWGPFSRVIFAGCFMDGVIVPQGWHNWGDTRRNLTVFYREYNCSGPGARISNRVPWSHQLTPAEAANFMNISFINGQDWLLYQ